MCDKEVIEENDLFSMTEQEILDFLFSLTENEQIIISKNKIKKVAIKNEK